MIHVYNCLNYRLLETGFCPTIMQCVTHIFSALITKMKAHFFREKKIVYEMFLM